MAPIVATHQQTAATEALRSLEHGVTQKPAPKPKPAPKAATAAVSKPSPTPAPKRNPSSPAATMTNGGLHRYNAQMTPEQAERAEHQAYEAKMLATMAHMRAQDEARRARRKKS